MGTTDLKVIDPAEFGIEEKKASQISAVFKPMLDKMEELENEFNAVIVLDPEAPETSTKARDLRLKYKNVRVETNKIHKEQKAFYLAGGRFVDALKNTQVFASQGNEAKLKDLEDYQAKKEEERLAKLRAERLEILEGYGVENSTLQVELMDSEAWEDYLSGVKARFLLAQEEAKKAEEARLEKERKEKLYASRKTSLIDLWAYVSDKEKAEDFGELSEEDFNSIKNNAKNRKAEAEARQKAIQEENEKLKKEAEEKAKAEAKARAEQEAKLKAEREAREKAEAELKAKQEAEEKAKQDLLKAGDKKKMELLIEDLESISKNYDFKSAKYQKLKREIDNDLKIIINGLL